MSKHPQEMHEIMTKIAVIWDQYDILSPVWCTLTKLDGAVNVKSNEIKSIWFEDNALQPTDLIHSVTWKQDCQFDFHSKHFGRNQFEHQISSNKLCCNINESIKKSDLYDCYWQG